MDGFVHSPLLLHLHLSYVHSFLFSSSKYLFPVRKPDHSGFLNKWSEILQTSPSDFCDLFSFHATGDRLSDSNYSILFTSRCESDTLLLLKLDPDHLPTHHQWFKKCFEFHGIPVPAIHPSSSSSSSSQRAILSAETTRIRLSCTVWPVDLTQNIWEPIYEEKGMFSAVPFRFRFMRPPREGIPQAM